MSEFLAMGGYAWYVWMSYGAAALAVIVEVAAVRARRRRAFEQLRMSAPGRARRRATAHGASMKARHRRFAWIGAGARRARRRGRAGAERVPVEPRVLLHAVAGGREGSAARSRPFRIGGLVESGQPEARSEFADRAVSRDRYRADASRSRTPGCCPTSSRKARASSRRARSAPTARSTRPKCSPSTTRTTCRPKRSAAIEQAQNATSRCEMPTH